MAYSCPECKGTDIRVDVTAEARLVWLDFRQAYGAEVIEPASCSYDDVSPARCAGCGLAAELVAFDEAQRYEEEKEGDDAENGTEGA